MKRGEAVRCIIDYDLFGVNIKNQEGCFVKHSNNDKYLIWCPCNLEWAELQKDHFELVNQPGYIPVRYKEFISRIKTLEYSYTI